MSRQQRPGLGGPFDEIETQVTDDGPGQARDLKHLDEFRAELRRLESNRRSFLQPLARSDAVQLLLTIANFVSAISEEETPIGSNDTLIVESGAKFMILEIANAICDLDKGVTDKLLAAAPIGTALMPTSMHNRKNTIAEGAAILAEHKKIELTSARKELAKSLDENNITFDDKSITTTKLNNWWRTRPK
jgi:hypothetical protein